jgi:hypothetical protein
MSNTFNLSSHHIHGDDATLERLQAALDPFWLVCNDQMTNGWIDLQPDPSLLEAKVRAAVTRPIVPQLAAELRRVALLYQETADFLEANFSDELPNPPVSV